MKVQIRQRSYKDQQLSELARDVQAFIDASVDFKVYTLTTVYAEPMYLALPSEPVGILALRIRQDASPETVVNHGVAVEYSWVPSGVDTKGRAEINNIDGMSVSSTLYRFTFLVVTDG